MEKDGYTVVIELNDDKRDTRKYIAFCSCGWRATNLRYSKHYAEDDGAKHLLHDDHNWRNKNESR